MTKHGDEATPPFYVPFFTELSNERMDSIYYCSRALIQRALTTDKIRFVVFVDEKWKAGGNDYWKVDKEGHLYVPVDYSGLAKFPFGVPNSSFFRIKQVQSMCHTFFCQQTCGSLMLKKMLGIPMLLHPQIVNWVHSDFNESALAIYPSHKFEVLCALAAGWNLFHNDAFFKRVTKHMRETFSGSFMRRYMKQSRSGGALGIDVHRIDNLKPFKGHDGKFVMLYGGRMSVQKGVDKMMEAGAKLVAMGVPLVFELFVTQEKKVKENARALSEHEVLQSLKKMIGRSDYKFVNLHVNAAHDDYFSMCKRADAFFCPSVAESYGISWVEQMFGGAVGVFLKKPWIEGILPPDYPFVANSLNDAVSMLYKIWKTGDGGVKERMREFILEYHNNDVYNDNIIEHLFQLTKALKERRKVTSWKEVMGE